MAATSTVTVSAGDFIVRLHDKYKSYTAFGLPDGSEDYWLVCVPTSSGFSLGCKLCMDRKLVTNEWLTKHRGSNLLVEGKWTTEGRKSKVGGQFFDDHENTKVHSHAIDRLKPNKLQTLLGAKKVGSADIVQSEGSSVAGERASESMAVADKEQEEVQEDHDDLREKVSDMLAKADASTLLAVRSLLAGKERGGAEHVVMQPTTLGPAGAAIDVDTGKPQSYVQRWINTLLTVCPDVVLGRCVRYVGEVYAFVVSFGSSNCYKVICICFGCSVHGIVAFLKPRGMASGASLSQASWGERSWRPRQH